MPNLMMPGNPRYQPKDLIPYFGYDNLMRPIADVEIATMLALGDIGVIPAEEIVLLTDEVQAALRSITTTAVDATERRVTKHDIRAWVYEAKNVLPEPLHRWVHVPLTSYDVIDTGRVLMFASAYKDVIRIKLRTVIVILAEKVGELASTVQIGRTHGQHALPVTVGFWLATVLNRLLCNLEELDMKAGELVGKISGAVGSYNAQVGLGIEQRSGEHTFERRVLHRLGLHPATISTQILSPEPLAYFLHAMVMLSATLGQFGRDCRHLMRSEIGEVSEEFEPGQVGSSTMAHKRNPVNFENIEGMWLRSKSEYGKVLDTLISEHQRDLVGSCVARDFPIIPINLTAQLDTLLRQNAKGVPFLKRITVSREACLKNVMAHGREVMAEPVYIAVQMAGYTGDAHKIVNEVAMGYVRGPKEYSFLKALRTIAEGDAELEAALARIPAELVELLQHPTEYVGKAEQKARQIAKLALDKAAV